MPLRDIWGRWREPEEDSFPAGETSGLPAIRVVPFDQVAQLAPLDKADKSRLDGQKFDAALILGLGLTGYQVVRSLVQRLERDPAGPQELLRPIIVTEEEVDEIHSMAVPVRQFDLLSRQHGSPENRSDSSQRAQCEALFRQRNVFDPFYEYLDAALVELSSIEGRDGAIRVFIIASAFDPEIGILGPLLQTLRLIQSEGKRSMVNFTLLLSLDSPQHVHMLDEQEMFAAMREIGRFTFADTWQWLPTLPLRNVKRRRSSVKGALVDYVFLMEQTRPPASSIDLTKLSFAEGLGQVLTSVLYLFIHPTGHGLWENLLNDLGQTGSLQKETRRPFVHSLGLATLYIPLNEIQDYVMSRLAYAAVFGEIDDKPEGLVTQFKQRYSRYTAGEIAKKWLYGRHELFNWVLDATHFRRMPLLNKESLDEFMKLLPADVAYGLASLLNDRDKDDLLEKARSELVWLVQRLNYVLSALEKNQPGPAETRRLLEDLLHDWLHALEDILAQVETWKKALLAGGAQPTTVMEPVFAFDPTPAWDSDDGFGDEVFDDDIFGDISLASPSLSDSRKSPEARTSSAGASLKERLLARRAQAEKALSSVGSNPIRQSLLADDDRGLFEAEKYYKGSIRPELSQHGEFAQTRFLSIRKRLQWWISLPRSGPPQIYILCVPADLAKAETSGVPSHAIIFGPNDIDELYHVLLGLAGNQSQDIESHLAPKWMGQRLKDPRFRNFLETADRPFLDYSSDQAAKISPLAGGKRRYLVGRSEATNKEQKRTAFPNITPANINELADSSATYLTALSLRRNIPLDAVRTISAAEERSEYHLESYLYPQERIAASYESRMRNVLHTQYRLPPPLIMPFTNKRDLSIFLQAVFEGLITVQVPKSLAGKINNSRYWVLPSFENEPNEHGKDDLLYRLLGNLDAYEFGEWESLFVSLRTFTLEATLDSEIYTNPSHPLNPNNFGEYTNRLFKATREIHRDGPRSAQAHRAFETTYLDPWKKEVKNDALGLAFIDLLQMELKRPIWNG